MSRLDDELRAALGRAEPPPDFTARVLARVAAEQAAATTLARPGVTRPRWWQALADLFRPLAWRPALAGALAAVIVAAGLGAGEYRRHRQERAEGERAKAQVMLALQIASAKLNVAQKKVQEHHRRGPGAKPAAHQQSN
jgi:hypothetical protein